MASSKRNLVLFILLVCGSCNAAVYRVGDDLGWAVAGHVDYNAWASSNAFEIGDTIIFEYDPRFHNVLQVTRSEFHSCNSTAPISVYATGNDSIVIHGNGHYYYICGFVGHCAAGQKVDVRVPKSRAAVLISSPVKAPEGSPVGTVALSPSPSGGGSILFRNRVSSNIGLLLIILWAFN